ncbi:aldehyde dehydrogenase [Lujinxingia litoralis]|uniref:Aldehyde dehydrogenase n=1 Tax=Lujinxingia litoralis TaxID=2211119 RepID=A0A328CCM2_9DELT|nr:aldehyde dehydrogenase family protein [Lujinxingia litoralis]RAL23927.1 aldehyde dehydrogenase [Lujinxingia litoralis]
MAPSNSPRLRVLKTFKLYIGGAFPRTESGRFLQEHNPKGQLVANFCRASRKDLRNSVVAARKAQAGWAGRTPFNRAQILYRMAEVLESRRESFEHALTERAGIKGAAAQAQVNAAIDRLVWYAGWADKFIQIMGTTNPVASPHFNITSPEPTGVVTAFAPRNAPLLGLITAIAPIIVSGNALVLVVENDHPSIAIDLAEVLHCSDLPGGVVNILTGQRDELIEHAAKHMDIDAIAAFDATDDERRLIAVEAAESVKRTHFFETPAADNWADVSAQSPYHILPFVEFKTAWHPIESSAATSAKY